MSKQLTIDFCKNAFKEVGYTLLDDVYINSKTKMHCVCSKGHRYKTTWFNWNINKSTCLVCNGRMKLTKSYIKNEFRKEGYILLEEYINSKKRMNVRCKKHHKYMTTYEAWRLGVRCAQCKEEIRKEKILNEITKSFKSENYKLLSTNYVNAETKLEFKCNKGHYSDISLHSWKKGHRCRKCSKTDKLDIVTVRGYIEKEGYFLISTKYVNCRTKLSLVCPSGHKYRVSWDHFRNKNSRCPLCARVTSVAEDEVFGVVKGSCNYSVIRNDRTLISPYELDIIIPDIKVAIEYCGLYWHSEKFMRGKNYHLNKLKLCEQVGYTLVTIFEDEWLHENDKVIARIKSYLVDSILDVNKFKLKYISTEDSLVFCNRNLLGKYKNCDLNIGVYNDDTIIATASFDLLNNNNYNMINFCSIYYFYNSKLFNLITAFFKTNYNYNSVSLLLNRRWDNYIINDNSVFIKYIKPSYLYINGNNKRSKIKDKYKNKIWDCGHLKLYKDVEHE